MQRFINKVVFISGAGSGIGRATAVRLAAEGAALYLADLNEAGLEQTQALLSENTRVTCRTVDVSKAGECRDAIQACLDEFGELNVLCNIAGIARCQNFTDISDADWQQVMDINLNGVFYLCKAAIPHLIKSKGNIVNMSSTAGLVGQAYNTVYCASKAAVLMLSKALAIEYAGKEVRVNAICPGAVATPLSQNFTMPDGADPALFARLMPLLPMAQAEEIAAAVAYLASDEARFVTGVEFAIDGGQTAG
jgi:meso-butanediol dehydrogenase/(S,S)-butanediol dehydrogenase/diacetyl reductase